MSSTEVQSSPSRAPEYVYHRKALTGADVIATVPKKHGCNAAMYKYCHIQVVPVTANPNVSVWWWSNIKDRFIQEHTPITKSGVGIGVAYEFTIEPKGRIFFISLDNSSGGTVDILVSGFQAEQFS